MFLLDSNAFIEAKNTYYSFEIAPGFWHWIEVAHSSGLLGSIGAVRDELMRQDDPLSDWARDLPASFWVPEDDGTIGALQGLAAWAMNDAPSFRQQARTDFLASADYRLIAAAKAGHHVVVTREQSAPESKRRILIPDACMAHHVECISPFDAYRQLGLRLAAMDSGR